MPPGPDLLGPPKERSRSWPATLGGLALISFTLYGLVSFGPGFEEVYRAAGVRIPRSTEALLGLSGALRVCVIPGALLLALYPWWFGRRPGGRIARGARTLSGFAILAFWFWAGWAFFQPVVGLVLVGAPGR